MKKSLVILFTSFYLLFAVGTTLSIHFCGGKVDKVSLMLKANKDCCGGNTKNMECCDDKEVTLKLNDIQNVTHNITLNHSLFENFNIEAISQNYLYSLEPSVFFIYSTHAPPDTSPPIHLMNRVFRI